MEEGDILRQRRNLVAMSCLLIIFDLAEVEVAKVGILGTDLVVGNVHILRISMWVVWAYFLLRYYQFWRQTGLRPLHNANWSEVERFRGRYIDKIASEFESRPYVVSKQVGRFGWDVKFFKRPRAGEPTGEALRDTRIHWTRGLAWYVRGAVRVAIHQTLVTEQILPFVLALAAPVVAIASAW